MGGMHTWPRAAEYCMEFYEETQEGNHTSHQGSLTKSLKERKARATAHSWAAKHREMKLATSILTRKVLVAPNMLAYM